ncbi:hypothetical protein BC939DRAFT_467095 [Gamsiella multidivaricata]|uniref:uncharacterized protein n=1 Tax=Gamsiella multidivaricata TaxID=101098 RepID=UPI002220720B|nr:uncharacterized protein BC939DRAFT_467095 [Gamsiella multidivaricata]KAI7817063.1 hypothetical protein BC939DRAFT_467095 [Gamsiella multidivaricata]
MEDVQMEDVSADTAKQAPQEVKAETQVNQQHIDTSMSDVDQLKASDSANMDSNEHGQKQEKFVAETALSTDASPATDATSAALASGPATDEAAPSTEAATAPPPQPIRTYIPQFKFTTFVAMAPLPNRNSSSNFLKTDKNFVLKDMAAKQRRRKRKVVEDPTQEGETRAEDSDEFSAIRRGIFADDEDEEDKDGDEQDDEAQHKDKDEDDYEDSSDSDSEASVVNEEDENGETKSSSNAGKKIIVIHPGSRILRIGRASDAYPVATPHCIARRMHGTATTGVIINGKPAATLAPVSVASTGAGQGDDTSIDLKDGEVKEQEQQNDKTDAGEDNNTMDVDGDDDEEEAHDISEVLDVLNDKYLQEIEYDLKLRMKAAKRRPVPNAKMQVRSFNTSTRPERILDHNDPYKVEWTDPAAEGEYIIGQKALNLPPGKNHTFKLFWPIVGGKLNDQDYTTPRVVVSDLETIWTKVIQDDLGIEPKKFRKHYALLVIPDLYNKLYVTELINMLLKSMQFRGVMVQQESVCAAYGAGVSTACVVDIGAEVTKVACVEDGICIPNSRAVLKYGGDDITRCFTALVKRTGFPYEELDLAQTYDWRLMEELKEKWCTMNEADLTVQVYSFFVRRPEKHTEKYQVKVYDEVALSPMCLFFPGVIRRWIEEREINPSFAKITNYEDINEDAPPIALMNQNTKKNTAAAAAAVAAARAGTPSLIAPGEENNGSNVGTPNATPAPTPVPSAVPPGVSAGEITPVVRPFAMEPSVTTTDKSWEIAGTLGKDNFSNLVALDVVVAQSISNCGSEERSKKLYGSIILVGGGGMVQGFDRVLEDRLFQALPATLTTVEKVEVLPSPRDMDPRLLVWKGASVLGKLETAKELWIKPLEWELMGRKALRDKSLFVWSKD